LLLSTGNKAVDVFCNRVFTMKNFLLGLLCVVAAFDGAAFADKPNIIVILADDLGCMDVGAFNPKTFYETPHIDSLAKRGMKFTQGYAACCVCSPTRGSIMTGKYPPRFGITNFIGGARSGKLFPAPNLDHLQLEEVTIAEALRDAGYTTFFAGKWHLGTGAFTPQAQGFSKDLQGDKQFYYPPSGLPLPEIKDDPKTTDRIVNDAVKFIGQHKDQPFFAYLPFLAVHTPIAARADLVAKYELKAKSAPPDAWGQEGKSKLRLVQNHAKYAAMLEQLDSGIGRVLAALQATGVAENTIIVFMSDNGGLSTSEGWPTSNLPLRGGKGWPYEGGVREPLIVVSPRVTKPGTTCDVPVISTDFYPTLLELAGLELKPEQHLDGVSFLPLLKGEATPRGKPLFWHYPHYSNQGGSPHGAIRDGDWKLIEWYEDGALELYNISQDLGEQTNLAAEKPKKAHDLHQQLIAWRKEVGALMPTPNTEATNNLETTKAKKKKQVK
jgi:arylsulfatase A-like enzyme